MKKESEKNRKEPELEKVEPELTEEKDEAKAPNEEAETQKDEETQTISEADQIEVLEEKIKALETEVSDWKDKLLRAHADLENTRKRLVKEKEEAIKYANTQLVEELLIPMDNLERAVASCSNAQDTKSIVDGISMVQTQLFDVLKKNGLELIASNPGTEFNPQEHEACMMETSADAEVETVQTEFSKGYKLHGRVVRPAKVKVLKPEV